MLFGFKKGMTAIFKNDKRYPVTCIEIPQHYIIKGPISEDINKRNKLLVGIPFHYAQKYDEMSERGYSEGFKCTMEVDEKLKEFVVNPLFKDGHYLDIRGKTIGKGFQGAMKRWGFKGQPATHGHSKSHRSLGSTGQNTSPAKVFKGKKMHGKMGNKLRWQCNLQVVETRENFLFVKGSIPGCENSLLILRDAYQRLGKLHKFYNTPILQ